MRKFQCRRCGKVYPECDLVRTKCSENMVGQYMATQCPKCLRKRQVGDLVELKEG